MIHHPVIERDSRPHVVFVRVLSFFSSQLNGDRATYSVNLEKKKMRFSHCVQFFSAHERLAYVSSINELAFRKSVGFTWDGVEREVEASCIWSVRFAPTFCVLFFYRSLIWFEVIVHNSIIARVHLRVSVTKSVKCFVWK